jgi:hypothetical protein
MFTAADRRQALKLLRRALLATASAPHKALLAGQLDFS